jgi:hypothetical protein
MNNRKVTATKDIKSSRLDEFAARITSAWIQITSKAVESIIKTGQMLIDAKNELDYGDWGRMFDENNEKKLPFTQRTAQRLMAIAKHPVLSNPTHVSHLPPCWGTLSALTRFDNAALERLIEEGTINPEMEREEVKEIENDLAKTGAYDYAEFCKAIKLLIQFQTRWVDNPAELTPHVFELSLEAPSEREDTTFSLDDLAQLLPWLDKLRVALVSEKRKHDLEYEEMQSEKRGSARMNGSQRSRGKKRATTVDVSRGEGRPS